MSGAGVRSLVVKVHIYAGLLTFSQLAIYGAAGLVATAHAEPRPRAAGTVRHVPFAVPGSKTDKEVADLVHAALKLPLTRPIPRWAIQRTPANDLLLDFYNMNGIYRVVVLEREQRLRIEELRNDFWLYLVIAHAVNISDPEAPQPMRAWGIYNTVAMWCFLGFCVSGVYLWLSAQARSLWAWLLLGAGSALLAGFWMVFRP